jgi:hypothetical protein
MDLLQFLEIHNLKLPDWGAFFRDNRKWRQTNDGSAISQNQKNVRAAPLFHSWYT